MKPKGFLLCSLAPITGRINDEPSQVPLLQVCVIGPQHVSRYSKHQSHWTRICSNTDKITSFISTLHRLTQFIYILPSNFTNLSESLPHSITTDPLPTNTVAITVKVGIVLMPPSFIDNLAMKMSGVKGAVMRNTQPLLLRHPHLHAVHSVFTNKALMTEYQWYK
jgi:hypothetical protein